MKTYLKGITTGILMTLLLVYFCMPNAVINHQKSSSPSYATIGSFLPATFLSGNNGGEKLNATALTAESLSEAETCTRVNNYKNSTTGQYGAFIPKALLDELYAASPDHNGVWVFLGKKIETGKTTETNFIIKTANEDISINHVEGGGYFRIDAMCPTYCDGLDLSKCK